MFFGAAFWHFPPTGALMQPWSRRREKREFLRRPTARLPEAAMFPDEETRVNAVQAVEKATAGAFITVTLSMMVMFFVVWLESRTLFRTTWLPPSAREAVMVTLPIASVCATWFFLQWLYRRRRQRLLRQRLLALGVPVCLACGYDLRALTEPRCPECGTGFDPKLLDGNTADNVR